MLQLQGRTYRLMSEPWWFEEIGLGVRLWEGRYEDHETTWVRWCDREGRPIPSGAERAEQEHQRAEQERERAEQARQELEQLRERLRQLGIDPPG